MRIKVGTAGILLLLNNPYKIAVNFKLLESLFPGRIDLGVVRGTANTNIQKALLGFEPSIDTVSIGQFEEKLTELYTYIHSNNHSELSNNQLPIPPNDITAPAFWLLGEGTVSSELAIKFGTNYCFSFFHSMKNSKIMETIERHRDVFQKKHKSNPNISIAVAGTCSMDMNIIKSATEKLDNSFIFPSVVGTPLVCQELLNNMVEKYKIDEVIFLDISRSYEEKIQSYILLSNALKLV